MTQEAVDLKLQPDAVIDAPVGSKFSVAGVEMILGGTRDGRVCLVTADSKPHLFFQLVRANVVVNDGTVVTYDAFIKHLRPMYDTDTSGMGHAMMSREALVNLLSSGDFHVA